MSIFLVSQKGVLLWIRSSTIIQWSKGFPLNALSLRATPPIIPSSPEDDGDAVAELQHCLEAKTREVRGRSTVPSQGKSWELRWENKYGQNGWEHEYMNMVHPQVISNVSWLQTSTNHFSSFLVDLGMVYYWAYHISPSIFHHFGTSGGIAGQTIIIIITGNLAITHYHTSGVAILLTLRESC